MSCICLVLHRYITHYTRLQPCQACPSIHQTVVTGGTTIMVLRGTLPRLLSQVWRVAFRGLQKEATKVQNHNLKPGSSW